MCGDIFVRVGEEKGDDVVWERKGEVEGCRAGEREALSSCGGGGGDTGLA